MSKTDGNPMKQIILLVFAAAIIIALVYRLEQSQKNERYLSAQRDEARKLALFYQEGWVAVLKSYNEHLDINPPPVRKGWHEAIINTPTNDPRPGAILVKNKDGFYVWVSPEEPPRGSRIEWGGKRYWTNPSPPTASQEEQK